MKSGIAMKFVFSTAVLFCFSFSCLAQGMFGANTGLGFTPGLESKKTLAVEGYYLHKISHKIYAGLTLFYQRYSVQAPVDNSGVIQYGDVIDIRQKSSFVFISPKVDYGIGYRKYLHVFATMGPGIYAGGSQISNTHSPYWTPPGGTPYGADTLAVNTTYNIPSVIMRYGLGLMERIPTHKYWNITLSQEINFMPGGLSTGSTPIQTPYFCFQIGIMHKYPHVFVEY
jgi:hypothetical protein